MTARSANDDKTSNQIFESDHQISQYEYWLDLTMKYDADHKDSALWAAIQLKEIALNLGENEKLGQSFRTAGIYYMDAGLYDQAITHYYQAMAYYDQSGITDREIQIALCYHDLAWVLTYQGDYERASSMFHKALSIHKVQDPIDSNDLLTSYHALGSFYYLYDPHIDSAEFYLKKAIQIGEALAYSEESMAEARLELANAYLFSDFPERADPIIQYLKQVSSDSLSGYSQAYIEYLDGLKLRNEGKYEEAIDKLLPVYQSLKQASNHQSETGINLLRQIVQTAEQGKLYQTAYEYLDLLRTTESQSIFKDRQRTTKALEIQYETARKEQQLSAKESQIALQRSVLWVSVISLIIVIGLLIWVYFTYQKVKFKNHKIEMLMRELHHRVKNNLQVISSLLGLQSMKLEDHKAQKAVREGKERIRAMSLIHQKLYQDENITSINIKDYMENLVDELAASYGYKDKAQLSIAIPDIDMDADTTLPLGLIVNELVSNAFKYAFSDIEKPVLALSLEEKKDEFHLILTDNGKGLPMNFSFDHAQSFGLKLVNLLVKQLKGQLNVSSQDGLSFQIVFKTNY